MTDDTNTPDFQDSPTENIEIIKAERDQYLDGWKRAKADIANIRREALFASENARKEAEANFLLSLFAVADSFDMARQSKTFDQVEETWRKGFVNTHTQLEKLFQEYSVEVFGTKGEVFDPMMHEPLMEREEAGQTGKVVEIIRKGYRRGDTVLRAAQVIIGK